MHWSIILEIDTPQKSQSPSTFALVDIDFWGVTINIYLILLCSQYVLKKVNNNILLKHT